MNSELDDSIAERTRREKIAHTENDVLANNSRLKQIFPHVVSSPTMKRFERDFDSYLENVAGLKVLDLGCGHGEGSLALLGRGATVAGIDISQTYVDDANSAASAAGYSAQDYSFSVMDAHGLTFQDETFDLVIGSGILHHLDLPVSLDEINRVLKMGGRALFKEPLEANPLLKLFRILTPKARTIDEKPLSRDDLRFIAKNWCIQSTYYGLISAPVAMMTSLLLRPFPANILLKAADWAELKLSRFPAMNPIHQYVLLNLVKR
jgi:ubiquinone/menaquinone biosynthesis C-methylase UbiE